MQLKLPARVLLTTIFLSIHLFALAQPAITPTWSVSLPAPAKWMIGTPNSMLLVAGSESLHGVDATHHGVVWTINDVPKNLIDNQAITLIDSLPYALAAYLDQGELAGKKSLLFNYQTGRILFSSEQSGQLLTGWLALPDQESILLETQKGDDTYLSRLNLSTGKTEWSKAYNSPDGEATKIWLKFKPNQAGDVLYTQHRQITWLSMETGEPYWHINVPKPVSHVALNNPGGVAYVGTESALQVVDLTTGQTTWQKPVSLPATVRQVITGPSNSLLVITKKGLISVDAGTGASLWRKQVETDQPLDQVYFLDDKLLVVAKSYSGATFQLVDYEGNLIGKPHNVNRPLASYRLMKDGVCYVTSYSLSALRYQEGLALAWEVPFMIQTKKLGGQYASDAVPVVGYDHFTDQMLCYTNQLNRSLLFAINAETLTYKMVTLGVDSRVEQEAIQSIESLEEGYLLTANRNAWLVAREGTLLYHRAYSEVEDKNSTLNALLSIGLFAVTGSIAANRSTLFLSPYQSFAQSSPIQSFPQGFQTSGRGLQFSGLRTRETPNSALNRNDKKLVVFSPRNLQKEQPPRFVILNKESGNEDNVILLRDSNPMILINAQLGHIYLVENKTQLACYPL